MTTSRIYGSVTWKLEQRALACGLASLSFAEEKELLQAVHGYLVETST